MSKIFKKVFLIASCLVLFSCQLESNKRVPYENQLASINKVKKSNPERFVHDIETPDGYSRIPAQTNSFAQYLRDLPLNEDPTVYLYDGSIKRNQSAQYAVIDRSPSNRDLMQCADAVIRLRSEYLFNEDQFNNISFKFVSGDEYRYQDYLNGKTPKVVGNKVNWIQRNERNNDTESLHKYLDWIYSYAGTASLIKELQPVPYTDIQIGDVLIQSGSPYGHAVIVVDICKHYETNQIAYMLAQSYMPAQDLHILKNPTASSNSPWYYISNSAQIRTPEWTFKSTDLKRF